MTERRTVAAPAEPAASKARPRWLRALLARWQPSLVRRVMLAIFLAYALTWLALVGFDFMRRSDTERISEGMQAFMRYQSEALDQMPTAAEAYAFTLSLEREFNRSRREFEQPDALMELQDHAGGRVFWMRREPLRGDAQEVKRWQHQGREHLLFRQDGARWSFLLAYPIPLFSDVVREIGGQLNVRLLISLPCLMLPIWLAVSRGLLPLRRLSERLARRRPNDLSPLRFDAPYRELKPLTAALDRLFEQLTQKQASERGFVRDAAHELRTPLAVIAAHVNVLALAEAPAQRAQAELQVNAAIARAAHLSQQLLDLSRLEGLAPLPAEALDVAALVRQVLRQVLPLALAKGQQLALDAPQQLLFEVNRHGLQTVLINLLDNAIRYCPAGAELQIVLQSKRSGFDDTLSLSVSDDGPGIPVEERERVFERFYRGAGQASGGGAGLGLAIVRQAAEHMDGEVELSEGPGGLGCCFTLRCVRPASAGAQPTPQAEL
ncbi:hypothetical protein LNV09_11805 [Paucibacter sp. B2R-40]|uniref:sensor histidine kinase n=1 Tax=Paucibacter sp. B2R-40 TaxID=2893554 RepID=UPI0021E4B015|nr:ATP-binding protein [Paucibacter sp. B2R-40]MCV2354842.1 hypothetical protein [Paucibacter sp. B2R-40]